MDMRTFGKDFQRYRDRAEKEQGVRFVRSRVHTVETVGATGDLRVVYVDNTGEPHEEIFDMIVLSTGQRPPKGMEALAEMTGVGLNPWGFCQTEAFSLAQTTREGVLAGGSVSGLKDISESVIQASSASLAAARVIHSKGGSLMEAPAAAKKPASRDVSRELPRVLVALCQCGDRPSARIPAEELEKWLKSQPEVAGVEALPHLCTREGWEALGKIAGESRANRILIGACMPYLYRRRLAELGEAVGLDPSLIDVVDVLTPIVSRGQEEAPQGNREVRSALAMGIGKLKGMDPLPAPSRRIVQKALVVGGGVAGMTSALALADQGYEVSLVEKEKELGGWVRTLKRTIEGHPPQEFLDGRIARVMKHPLIHVHTGSRVVYATGHVGRFSTTIEKADGVGETLEHGVTVLATGGGEARTVSYGYGQSPLIVTQHELEEKLASGSVQPEKLKSVVMIQCVDSREEPRNYCSRICCASALKNALYLKEKSPGTDLFILYRDIMSYGFLETYYTQARRAGVIFVQYRPEEKPEVAVEDGRPVVSSHDPILGRRLVLRPDLLVLSTGLVPGNVKDLAGIFGVPLNRDGFYQEADSKWRPVDFIKEGLFVCGTAHSPRSIAESVAMAEAAAQRALRILSRERIASGSVVAEVRTTLCSLCERCIAACPYGARALDDDGERIVVDELMCQGCGSCAAVCPNSASVLRGYKDRQVFDVIDAALETALAFEGGPA
jgi:heterodisulfide reductase subunit A